MLPHPTEERRLGERETEGGGAVHGGEGPLIRSFVIHHQTSKPTMSST
jgi:hypothetical protein